MDFQCVIDERQSQPTLCVRTRAPATELRGVLGRAFGEILAVMGAQGQRPVGEPYVGYGNYDMNDLDLEIGFPAARPLEGRGDVVPSELPGGAWASTMHVGPYDQVGPAWEALHRFIVARQRQVGGRGYEFYLDGPETPPAQLRTRIAFPLAP